MLMSSDVNRKGRSQLEHPAVKKDQMLKVGHFVAGFERRSFPPMLHIRLKGESISVVRGSYLCLFLPFNPFRCIPSTDGRREAGCQQGSEQPFPGAPTCLAPPYYTPPCLSLDPLLHTY